MGWSDFFQLRDGSFVYNRFVLRRALAEGAGARYSATPFFQPQSIALAITKHRDTSTVRVSAVWCSVQATPEDRTTAHLGFIQCSVPTQRIRENQPLHDGCVARTQRSCAPTSSPWRSRRRSSPATRPLLQATPWVLTSRPLRAVSRPSRPSPTSTVPVTSLLATPPPVNFTISKSQPTRQKRAVRGSLEKNGTGSASIRTISLALLALPTRLPLPLPAKLPPTCRPWCPLALLILSTKTASRLPQQGLVLWQLLRSAWLWLRLWCCFNKPATRPVHYRT